MLVHFPVDIHIISSNLSNMDTIAPRTFPKFSKTAAFSLVHFLSWIYLKSYKLFLIRTTNSGGININRKLQSIMNVWVWNRSKHMSWFYFYLVIVRWHLILHFCLFDTILSHNLLVIERCSANFTLKLFSYVLQSTFKFPFCSIMC